MALVTSLAGYTSDSYVSVVEADNYFINHWDTTKSTAWDALADEQKEGVLKQAVRIIESLPFHEDSTASSVSFVGNIKKNVVTPAVTNQSLSFPRNIDLDANDDLYIPADVKEAQCEQAIFMVSSMSESVIQARMRGLISESIKADTVSVSQSFSSGGGGSADIMSMMVSPIAHMLLKKYIIKTTRLKRM